MEAEADLERVLVIDDRDTPLTLADERIARAIRENNARLVIIDPVQAFLGADVDMNRANAVSYTHLDVYKRQIQALLGHRDPKSTEIYLHVSNKTLLGIKSPFDEMGGE